jgi:hypothetical protein
MPAIVTKRKKEGVLQRGVCRMQLADAIEEASLVQVKDDIAAGCGYIPRKDDGHLVDGGHVVCPLIETGVQPQANSGILDLLVLLKDLECMLVDGHILMVVTEHCLQLVHLVTVEAFIKLHVVIKSSPWRNEIEL